MKKRSGKRELVERLKASPTLSQLSAKAIEKLVNEVFPTEHFLDTFRERSKILSESAHEITDERLGDVILAGLSAYSGLSELSQGNFEEAQETFKSVPSVSDISPPLIVAVIQQASSEYEAAKSDGSRSEKARRAADSLHNKPGGSRSKSEAIRREWASGKYSSRDICAEQECAALGMSFSAARKALRGTPDPQR